MKPFRPRIRSKGIGRIVAVLIGLSIVIASAGMERLSIPAAELSARHLSRTDLSAQDTAQVAAVTAPTDDFSKAEPFEALAGGGATSRKTVDRESFSHPSANLNFEDEQDFKLGNDLFRKFWVSSPSSSQASTPASDGLGPLFNARACQSCHLRDGRGHPPESDRDATSMFLRLARPPRTAQERLALEELQTASLPDPVYGGQFQDRTLPGLPAEGRMVIDYETVEVILGDGSTVSLRQPTYSVTDLGYGPLDAQTTLSPRIAPPMTGMGLIQAIHPADIHARADEDDANAEGISGKVALARDARSGDLTIGRFGWKAQTATVREQSANAFAGDIGISTPDVPRHYGDCTDRQAKCLGFPTGVQPHIGDTEAPDPVLDLVTFYSENLAVPARRTVGDRQVLRGKKIFYETGCIGCHAPKYVTRRDADHHAHAFQLIWPYSDFLLHDMGEGLADGQPVGVATGSEWRTPPLWGIGLTQTVSGHTFFLHDGRARNLTEAILWHGGEAQSARDRFAELPQKGRTALIRFLGSL